MKQVVVIEGMHCQACSARVERVFAGLDAVESCRVELGEKKAVLEVREALSEELVRTTVEDLGFDFISLE